ncbi:28S ribosomal protein S18b, mitochondrial [Drosophila guanche]|uniref:Small ribosomal subunit protein mS40 n=1 Tax=Drosophila guanche TaxID=7266 RepID=A0A3B0KHV3_DROGU|nr:28S ribosomal protein S18b, mitochondrial [Drosophila guanche]SPP85979.1 blast:28S ribosomal protein S18b%2C mitochondrial [Drosophila guanche]
MLPIARGIYNGLASITRSSRGAALHTASAFRSKAETAAETENEAEAADGEEAPKSSAPDPKDRTQVIPVETSMRYLKSAAYKKTYGEDYVWTQYRRNHKGMYAPRKTRKTCIRQGKISTGNPCPICRDEYLVLDYRNTELLEQFISPHSGDVLSYSQTGLCQKSHLRLRVAVEQARDSGLITYDVPFREYDYNEYYGQQKS